MPSTTVLAALMVVDTTSVNVTDNGDTVTVTPGDDSAAVQLTGPLHDVYRAVFEVTDSLPE